MAPVRLFGATGDKVSVRSRDVRRVVEITSFVAAGLLMGMDTDLKWLVILLLLLGVAALFWPRRGKA